MCIKSKTKPNYMHSLLPFLYKEIKRIMATLNRIGDEIRKSKKRAETQEKEQLLVYKLKTEPYYFTKEILGTKLWKKQKRILKRVMNLQGEYKNKTCVKSCHGIGKSYTAAQIALQFLYTYSPSIVITTAPTFRQVEKTIWKEIRTSYRNAKINLGGNLSEGTPNLQILKDQWYLSGIATNDGDKLQGIHEDHILIIVDESAGVSESIFEAIEAILTSANAHLLIIGNPTSTTGYFRKAFSEKGWNKITVSAFDTPNFTAFGITEEDILNGTWEEKIDGKLPYPKLITPQWVADKYQRWGRESTFVKTRIRAEFDETGSDSIVSLAWLDAAVERNKELPIICDSKKIVIGVDVAEHGRDSSIACIKRNRYIQPMKEYKQMKVMELASHLKLLYESIGANNIKVDTIGVGTGVEGRLEEYDIKTYRVNVAEGPGGDEEEKEKHVNKRAQLYWNLRELLDPDNPHAIGIPDDDELIEELLNTKYKLKNGKIQIIAKDDIKAVIGRSPDKADALMIACAPDEYLTKLRSAGTW